MELFTEKARLETYRIFQLGCEDAALTLSKVVHQPISLQEIDVQVSSTHEFDFHFQCPNDCNYLLTTEVIGELKGKSFLCFTQQEVDTLSSVAFPNKAIGEITPSMVSALLLELDNMLSARVITQIANILDIKIFGDVPELYNVEPQEVKPMISEALSSYVAAEQSEWVLMAHVKFLSEGDKSISPCFFWKFTDPLLKAIHSFSLEATQ